MLKLVVIFNLLLFAIFYIKFRVLLKFLFSFHLLFYYNSGLPGIGKVAIMPGQMFKASALAYQPSPQKQVAVNSKKPLRWYHLNTIRIWKAKLDIFERQVVTHKAKMGYLLVKVQITRIRTNTPIVRNKQLLYTS